jgi:hypothetical protein
LKHNSETMEYNSSRPHLIIPEYGRNVQKMINYALTVEDRDERSSISRSIVAVMGYLNPHLRDVTDFKHKLWDHLFFISNFKLDVDSPYPIPSAETMYRKPDRIPYPSNKIRFKHYGKTVEVMIEKAMQMEEGEMKEAFVCTVANFMKMAYVNWNRDSVSDELILEQLKTLSGGALTLKDTFRLNDQPLEFTKKAIKPATKQGLNRNPGMNKLNLIRKNKKK